VGCQEQEVQSVGLEKGGGCAFVWFKRCRVQKRGRGGGGAFVMGKRENLWRG